MSGLHDGGSCADWKLLGVLGRVGPALLLWLKWYPGRRWRRGAGLAIRVLAARILTFEGTRRCRLEKYLREVMVEISHPGRSVARPD